MTTGRKTDPGERIVNHVKSQALAGKARGEVEFGLLARNHIDDLDEEARKLSDSALEDCLSPDKIEDKPHSQLRILF